MAEAAAFGTLGVAASNKLLGIDMKTATKKRWIGCKRTLPAGTNKSQTKRLTRMNFKGYRENTQEVRTRNGNLEHIVQTGHSQAREHPRGQIVPWIPTWSQLASSGSSSNRNLHNEGVEKWRVRIPGDSLEDEEEDERNLYDVPTPTGTYNVPTTRAGSHQVIMNEFRRYQLGMDRFRWVTTTDVVVDTTVDKLLFRQIVTVDKLFLRWANLDKSLMGPYGRSSLGSGDEADGEFTEDEY
ncbi:hypothetical protein BT96DRAFT_1082550 [Gymnopus androsaceus JB14]|uniref:Uncharacterized protein n=1 Tax=Gymnopus androsaceus JB14 TaxID=1447944 RepID=A0A6A4I106_9AGAR|nr:hypothetical protein BT96DRAFT_1082550 [Gymnopus androsaceus JB14]